ncbi:MAG: YgaP family membrane protein [Desulfitobacteriaceae bacterium]
MKCNVGKIEQSIRIGIGIVIILMGLYFRSWWGIIGIAPIITGTIRYCPLSEVLGVSTCEAENKD